jgi:hypothetical protein
VHSPLWYSVDAEPPLKVVEAMVGFGSYTSSWSQRFEAHTTNYRRKWKKKSSAGIMLRL